MSAPRPPRIVEGLLDGLSARTAFSEGVLGDLAEEFARRSGSHGERAARRWYLREAFRSAPHLVADYNRAFRFADVRNMASSVLVSTVFTAMIVMFAGAFTFALVYGLGLNWHVTLGGSAPSRPAPLALAASWIVTTGISAVGGAIAAWLADRAPIMTAMVLGLVWAFALVLLLTSRVALVPAITYVTSAAVLILGTTLGGVVQVTAKRVRSA